MLKIKLFYSVSGFWGWKVLWSRYVPGSAFIQDISSGLDISTANNAQSGSIDVSLEIFLKSTMNSNELNSQESAFTIKMWIGSLVEMIGGVGIVVPTLD